MDCAESHDSLSRQHAIGISRCLSAGMVRYLGQLSTSVLMHICKTCSAGFAESDDGLPGQHARDSSRRHQPMLISGDGPDPNSRPGHRHPANPSTGNRPPATPAVQPGHGLRHACPAPNVGSHAAAAAASSSGCKHLAWERQRHFCSPARPLVICEVPWTLICYHVWR